MRVRNDSKIERSLYVHGGSGFHLLPGTEVDVPDKAWSDMLKKPGLKAWMDEGILTIGKGKAKADESNVPATVESVAGKSAIADQLAELGYDLETLAAADIADLTELEGVGKATAKRMIAEAKAANV